MGTYLKTREKIAKNNTDFKKFLGIMEYRYETLGNTLSYIQQIWIMTKNYVNSALEIYNGLQNKITQKAINNLTVITALSACAALFALLARSDLLSFSLWGLLGLGIVLAAGILLNLGIRFFSGKGKYKISGKDYEKFK